MKLLVLATLIITTILKADKMYGELIFQDDFERTESQEKKDEPGNNWTTSSEKTAYGSKQVDLRDGHMYIYTHKKAWHATSVRHAFKFKNGTMGIKVLFDNQKDSLKLNFTDLSEKSVHAGHLFNVTISPESITFEDLKTGVMNLKIKEARKVNTLTNEQKRILANKTHCIKNILELGKWHQVYVTIKDDTVTCTVNCKIIGSFKSQGIAHETKSMIRLLVPRNAHVDEVRIWKIE